MFGDMPGTIVHFPSVEWIQYTSTGAHANSHAQQGNLQIRDLYGFQVYYRGFGFHSIILSGYVFHIIIPKYYKDV